MLEVRTLKVKHKVIQVEHKRQASDQAKQADFNQALVRPNGEIMLSKLIGTEERNYRSYEELWITLSPDHCCCTAAAREKTERTAPIDVHT